MYQFLELGPRKAKQMPTLKQYKPIIINKVFLLGLFTLLFLASRSLTDALLPDIHYGAIHSEHDVIQIFDKPKTVNLWAAEKLSDQIQLELVADTTFKSDELNRNGLSTTGDHIPTHLTVASSLYKPILSTDYFFSEILLPDEVNNTLTEISGLPLNANGQLGAGLDKTSSHVKADNLAIIPTIRNWDQCHPIYASPVDTLLVDPELRESHINAIVETVKKQNYQGIEIDYRGLDPKLGQAYTSFLTSLRHKLPDDKQLFVQIEQPRQMSSTAWDTGAYDWAAIGRLADVVKLPISFGPQVDTADKQTTTDMLDWAVEQVKRQKIQLVFYADSTQWLDDTRCNLSNTQALKQIGHVTQVSNSDSITPGQELNFTLTGLPASTGVQIDQGTYWFAYLDQNNRHHTIYLENITNLIDSWQWARHYNLRGVAIQGMSDNSNTSQIWGVVQNFLQGTDTYIENHYTLTWQVQTQAGQIITEEKVDLSRPNYQWTAPKKEGIYQVTASVSSNQNPTSVSLGRVTISVVAPMSAGTSPALREKPGKPLHFYQGMKGQNFIFNHKLNPAFL